MRFYYWEQSLPVFLINITINQWVAYALRSFPQFNNVANRNYIIYSLTNNISIICFYTLFNVYKVICGLPVHIQMLIIFP